MACPLSSILCPTVLCAMALSYALLPLPLPRPSESNQLGPAEWIVPSGINSIWPAQSVGPMAQADRAGSVGLARSRAWGGWSERGCWGRVVHESEGNAKVAEATAGTTKGSKTLHMSRARGHAQDMGHGRHDI